MNFLQTSLSFIKKNLAINDSIKVLYLISFFIVFFNTGIIFDGDSNYYQGILMVYFIMSMPYIYNKKRVDLSKNIFKYLLVGIALLFILPFLIKPNIQALPFTSFLSMMFYYIIIQSLSETFFQLYILKETKNIFISSIFMGLLHTSLIAGVLSLGLFSLPVLWNVIISSLLFFIFYLVYNWTGDEFIVAILHGMINMAIVGGLIL